ncbi:MAG TPA: ArsR family transcriptional regulator [Steroidobacteraceae bacterium]|nr:ArsR family transcriptional regulator [Steroidobacteraceae bacterium]
MNTDRLLRALANRSRLQILQWLRSPQSYFPPQVYGDLVKDGVCGILIAQKLKVSHPTVSEHLKILSQAGLIRGKRIKQWTFYRRDERSISNLKAKVLAQI